MWTACNFRRASRRIDATSAQTSGPGLGGKRIKFQRDLPERDDAILKPASNDMERGLMP
jgi:hypothetical protein